MDQIEKLYITATAMLTPVGSNTAMTAALVNAGISAFQETTIYDGYFSPIKIASVPEDALPPLSAKLRYQPGITARQSRMLRLAQPALGEVLTGITEPLALFLAGPEPLLNGPLPMRSIFLKHLQIQTDFCFDSNNSKVFPMGRAGAFCALEYAFRFLESSDQDLVLVGGVDTYWDAMTLAVLAKDNRLITANGGIDGFVPGEGAAFILLSRNEYLATKRHIFRPGLSEEPGHRYSEVPYKGEGLSLAFRQAIQSGSIKNIQHVYSGLNGESYGSKEYGVAMTRNSSILNGTIKHTHPADCYGDLGAASGVALLALSSVNNASPSLCYCSSDAEFRGAACVV